MASALCGEELAGEGPGVLRGDPSLAVLLFAMYPCLFLSFFKFYHYCVD